MNNEYHNPNENWYYHQKNQESEGSCKACMFSFAGIVIILLLSLLLSGCKSIQYVPVETVRTEYKNHTDTVKEIDSIFSERETIIREADSALIAKLGLQLKANERAILVLKRQLEREVKEKSESHSDTVIIRDSVQVPYPVEKQLTKWEQTKMQAGGISIVVCILLIAMIIVGFIIKAHRRS